MMLVDARFVSSPVSIHYYGHIYEFLGQTDWMWNVCQLSFSGLFPNGLWDSSLGFGLAAHGHSDT